MNAGELVLVMISLAIGFFAKGVTGIGGPLVAVPVLAGFTGVEEAVVVVAIPTLAANAWLLWTTRDSAEQTLNYVRPLVVASVVGAALGALALTRTSDRVLAIVLALLILTYLLVQVVRPEIRLTGKQARLLASPVGLAGGVLAGSTGIAAPVVATYFHAMGFKRAAFVFAISLPFLIFGIVQIASYSVLGVLTGERLISGLAATIPTLGVIPFGSKVGERLPQQAFRFAVLVVLALSTLRLLWEAI